MIVKLSTHTSIHWLLVVFCWTIGFQKANSVGVSNRWLGLEQKSFSASSLAMGGISILGSRSIADATRNPAQLQYFSKGLQIETLLKVPQTIESRSFPIYDSFGGTLAENQYVSNSMGTANFGGAFSLPLKSQSSLGLTVAIFSVPLLVYDYRFVEEVRDRFSTGGLQDRVRGRVEDFTKGTRQWSGFAFAKKMNDQFSFGFSVGMIGGKVQEEYRLNRILPSDSTFLYKTSREPDNAHIQAGTGLVFEINPRVTLGWNLTYRGDRNEKMKITQIDTVTTQSTTIKTFSYPISTGLAIQWIPGQQLSSTMITEIEYTYWKDASLGIPNQTLYNTLEIRAGVEHRVLPEVPVRFGYTFVPSPFDPEKSMTYLSVGTGYQKKNWLLDLGVQFGHSTSKEDDPVPDNAFGGQPRMDQDRVQTRMVTFGLTVSYRLGEKN
ncbi:MAG: hypothetical protein N2450_05475 [bacterium]|nr:hypothetical protein [bacterium]